MIGADAPLDEVCFIVGDALHRAGVTAVLTGGSAATVYAPGAYQSDDIDFVLTFGPGGAGAAARVLAELGFNLKNAAYHHRNGVHLVEFPPGPLAIGDDQITKWDTFVRHGRTLSIISPTDCVRNRLASYYYFRDRTALGAVVVVALAHRDRIDVKVIKRWSEREAEGIGRAYRIEERLQEFLDRL
ncbi:hypothetical protein EPN44_14860 [bacterium]|nr:MAG: hypothetical protein EPN44_14860 [bacterium]